MKGQDFKRHETEATRNFIYYYSRVFLCADELFVRKAGDLPTMQKGFFRNVVAMCVAGVMLARSEGGFSMKREVFRLYLCGQSAEHLV